MTPKDPEQIVAEVSSATAFLRRIADDGHGRGLLEFTDHLNQAVNSFGRSELYARRAENRVELDIQPMRAESFAASKEDHNGKGLRSLDNGRASLRRFREDLAGYPQGGDIGDQLDRLQRDLREALADTDLKPSDTRRIDQIAGECFNVVRRQGAAGLPDYFDERVNQLEQARRRPDRGAVENIPFWKAAAIAVMIGVSVWAIFKCNWWGGCTEYEAAGYGTAIALASVVLGFC